MPDLLKRLGGPLVVVALLLVAIVSMVDRPYDASARAGVALPWWQATLLEVTAPIERLVSAPIDGVKGFYRDYVDLLGGALRERTPRGATRGDRVGERPVP